MGGIVGSSENMWSQSRACIHRARLSTSLAMGPEDEHTKLARHKKKWPILLEDTAWYVENDDKKT